MQLAGSSLLPSIVALTGKRFSGKDTAAKVLVNFGYQAMAFADPIREILNIVYGVTMEEFTDPVLKEKPLDRFPWRSPRDLMTIIGTQGFRDLIHQCTWVKVLERRALNAGLSVITDLRFLTEEAMLHQHDATIIRIVRPDSVRDDDTSRHRSETEMDQIVAKHTIVNDGSIADLQSKVLRAVVGGPII